MDYESAINHSYQVTATKNGESKISGVITFRVDNETYSAHGMFPENARDGIFLSVNDAQLGGSTNDNRVGIFAAYDIGDKSASEKKLFALDNGLPAGTTFNCSLNAMTSFVAYLDRRSGNMSVSNSSFFSYNNPYPVVLILDSSKLVSMQAARPLLMKINLLAFSQEKSKGIVLSPRK